MNKVFLGVPCHGGVINEGTARMIMSASNGNVAQLRVITTSLLPRGFNTLYAQALNLREAGITHFCLIHADIVPVTPFWVDHMLQIMEQKKADVLSAVSPMKSPLGLTSTAIDENPHTGEWDEWRVKRLTMKEIFEKEPTFTGSTLLVNTGLLLIDLRNPKAKELFFEFQDRIVYTDGRYKAVGVSEDWQFSRLCHKLELSVWATREVGISHIGPAAYGNQVPWGEWDSDKE